MRKLVNDLTGKRFGKLVVIGVADDGQRKTSYICQCDCGNVKKIRADGLTSGATKSCGCLKRERTQSEEIQKDVYRGGRKPGSKNKRGKTSGTRLYWIWQGMKGRCYNPNDARYDRYGGRGLTVCDEWKNDYIAFHNWALANGYTDDLTIDRIDNDKGYSPDNCRWATIKEQCNNRSTNINITIGNSTRNLTEWCEIFGLDYKKVNARYHRGSAVTLDDLFRR